MIDRNLQIKIFADGADLSTMLQMASQDYIKGLTTNPTLMKKAGVLNYKEFASQVLSKIKTKPISFEVFSDDFDEMILQAQEISSWAENVYVKIPVTNSKGVSSKEVIKELSAQGVKLNVTAILTLNQVQEISNSLNKNTPSYISIFAGRIADTGQDPLPIMKKSIEMVREYSNWEIIWASPRELLNVIQAEEIGCHIITATSDILKKLNLIGKDLTEYSLETVQMFRNDALSSGFSI
jgi:transaldolase